MMVLGKPQLHAKFEVAGFICYGHIREFILNPTNLLFGPPFGGVRGNVRELLLLFVLKSTVHVITK